MDKDNKYGQPESRPRLPLQFG